MKVAKKLGVDDAIFLSTTGDGADGEVRQRLAHRGEEDGGERGLGLSGQGRQEDSGRLDEHRTRRGSQGFVERLLQDDDQPQQGAGLRPASEEAEHLQEAGATTRSWARPRRTSPSSPRSDRRRQRRGGARGAPAPSRRPSRRTTYSPRTGPMGTDVGSSILLNIRSFTERNASGHGLSCSSTLKGLDAREAGQEGGRARQG